MTGARTTTPKPQARTGQAATGVDGEFIDGGGLTWGVGGWGGWGCSGNRLGDAAEQALEARLGHVPLLDF
jgi:hypothetical protein